MIFRHKDKLCARIQITYVEHVDIKVTLKIVNIRPAQREMGKYEASPVILGSDHHWAKGGSSEGPGSGFSGANSCSRHGSSIMA